MGCIPDITKRVEHAGLPSVVVGTEGDGPYLGVLDVFPTNSNAPSRRIVLEALVVEVFDFPRSTIGTVRSIDCKAALVDIGHTLTGRAEEISIDGEEVVRLVVVIVGGGGIGVVQCSSIRVASDDTDFFSSLVVAVEAADLALAEGR